ncbi:hypothetical protein PspLS_00177 [Pyricularia sp. CBS 133598]|nr:hypothetical protein PspLS_00177 [Pyricularia sp. CBS 133598]
MLAKFLLPFLVTGVLATPIPAGKEGATVNKPVESDTQRLDRLGYDYSPKPIKAGGETFKELFGSNTQRPKGSGPETLRNPSPTPIDLDTLSRKERAAKTDRYVGGPLGMVGDSTFEETFTRKQEIPAGSRPPRPHIQPATKPVEKRTDQKELNSGYFVGRPLESQQDSPKAGRVATPHVVSGLASQPYKKKGTTWPPNFDDFPGPEKVDTLYRTADGRWTYAPPHKNEGSGTFTNEPPLNIVPLRQTTGAPQPKRKHQDIQRRGSGTMPNDSRVFRFPRA